MSIKNKNYIRHLIECQCVLPIFKKNTKIIYHKFPVFSLIDEESNTLKHKYVSCNNCDIIHKVFDINKSNIMWGKEGYKTYVITKDDIRITLEQEGLTDIVNLLYSADCDVSIWELTNYVFENNIEDQIIVIESQEIENNVSVKYIELKDKKFKIKKEIYQKDLML